MILAKLLDSLKVHSPNETPSTFIVGLTKTPLFVERFGLTVSLNFADLLHGMFVLFRHWHGSRSCVLVS